MGATFCNPLTSGRLTGGECDRRHEFVLDLAETMTQPEGLDTVGRFSDRAADYVRYRPSYPTAAIDLILEGLGCAG